MSIADAEDFREILLQVARTHDVEIGKQDDHGQRYLIDFTDGTSGVVGYRQCSCIGVLQCRLTRRRSRP